MTTEIGYTVEHRPGRLRVRFGDYMTKPLPERGPWLPHRMAIPIPRDVEDIIATRGIEWCNAEAFFDDDGHVIAIEFPVSVTT